MSQSVPLELEDEEKKNSTDKNPCPYINAFILLSVYQREELIGYLKINLVPTDGSLDPAHRYVGSTLCISYRLKHGHGKRVFF